MFIQFIYYSLCIIYKCPETQNKIKKVTFIFSRTRTSKLLNIFIITNINNKYNNIQKKIFQQPSCLRNRKQSFVFYNILEPGYDLKYLG